MARPTDELIPTRTTLLERLKDWRDESSWQDFFDTYWKLIYGVAIKRGLTETEAEDVVQETMISVAKHIPTFKYDRSIGSFKGWLLNMTRWRIANQFRKRKPASVHPLRSCDADTGIQPSTMIIDPGIQDWESVWDAEWERNLFDAAMIRVKRRLAPQKFQVFDFYVNKGWRPDKVAKTFGLSMDQVYLAKHRVLQIIKEEVERLKREVI
jgi:RNA polymerase sigma factor (sigma-70 family)